MEDGRRLVARGYAHAFQGEFAKAQADFREALAIDPENLGALSGLGYALAWSGSFPEAEAQFRQALQIAPGQPDAAKGLAYVALWRGDAPEAARRFEALTRAEPGSAEAQVGLGQSLLAAGRRPEAHLAFGRALDLEPERKDARLGLEASRAGGLRLDAIAFGGLTASAGSRTAGLRFAELGASSGGTRFWFQFDDSLSLDALGLARRNQHEPSYYFGGLATWGDVFATRLEGGWRSLPGVGVEPLVRAEQIVSIREAISFKLGGFVGPRPDGIIEASGHVAVQIPLSARVILEPAVFYGRSGLPGEHEVRGQLAAGLRLASGIELDGGIAAGRAFSPVAAFDGPVSSLFAKAAVPIASGVRTELLVKHDRPQAAPPTTAYALGLAFSFGGRQ